MTTAKKRFKLGDRVHLTLAGYKQFKYMKIASDQGKVVGFGRSPHMVAVLVDGRLTADRYHFEFWEKIRKGKKNAKH